MGKIKQALTKRDQRMLDFVDRYRLATNDLFRRVFFAGPNRGTDGRPRRPEARAARTAAQGGIRRRSVLRRYSPTRVSCDRRADRAPRPLTEQSLPVALAIAAHCVRAGLVRFKDREFRERYPELWRPGLRSSSYFLIDTPQGLQLGMFLVDRGGTARRIKGKIRRLITQRAPLPAFGSLIEARRFRVTVLTGLPAQKQNIRRHLGRLCFRKVEIEVALVPELGELLTMR